MWELGQNERTLLARLADENEALLKAEEARAQAEEARSKADERAQAASAEGELLAAKVNWQLSLWGRDVRLRGGGGVRGKTPRYPLGSSRNFIFHKRWFR